MLLLTAPAKTLNLTGDFSHISSTQPLFLPQSTLIAKELKKMSAKDLENHLHVSKKIADENYERMQKWDSEHTVRNSRPALFTFAGDIFQKMNVGAYDERQMSYAQKSMRILSGFYGFLRPLDLMQPYRLEMKTASPTFGPLHSFWRPILTEAVTQDIRSENHTHVINLASAEYSAALDLNKLPCPVVNVRFLHRKNDEEKTVAIHAKWARGMMMNYCIQHGVQNIEDLCAFDCDGYRLTERNEGEITFVKTL